jgi:sulfite exporter TauE/SafE/copper chaperone CopZ
MTCRACEVRIQRHVGRLPGVTRVSASASRGRVVIESAKPIPPRVIERAINQAGYELGDTPWIARDRVAWIEVALSFWVVVVLVIIAQVTGLLELASGVGDLATGGIAVALLLGLAAGFSTCAVLVGGLVLALSAAFEAGRHAAGGDPPLGTRMRPALVFTIGRIAGYGLFGALLGALGASVAMPPQLTALLMIAVAVLMTLLGTRLTGLSPRLAGWSPTLPMGLGRWLGLGEGELGGYSDARAGLLGAASFFLPCGFTQAVQVYALSTGSPVVAAALLATFAIGTAPGLLTLVGLPAILSGAARPTFLRFIGVVVLAFAVVNANAGLALAGIGLPWMTGPAAGAPSGVITAAGAQVLKTYQEARGYSPANVTIDAGVPTTWTIESTAAGSCATALVVPSLGISARLKLGPNTIDLPALPAGVLRYSCSMGMYSGTITVVPPPAA